MKKLALLIGSLMVIGTAVQAKETIVTPIIIEEIPTFRPSGTFMQELEYFGNGEGQTNSDSVRFRAAEGFIQMTERLSGDFRLRYNFNVHDNNETGSDGSDFRTRWYYDAGYLGDTKVNLTHRIRFEKTTKFLAGDAVDPEQDNLLASNGIGLDLLLSYQPRFNFKEYFTETEYVKVTNFTLAPFYGYQWENKNTSNSANLFGVDLYTNYNFPADFTFELNFYAFNTWQNTNIADSATSTTDKTFTIAMEALLYYNHEIYRFNEDTKLSLAFEGGYDPYIWKNKDIFRTRGNTNLEGAERLRSRGFSDYQYYLKAIPELRIDYQATESFNTYLRVKGVYANRYTTGSDAQEWRWNPEVVIGWETKF
ncbi:MAG: hypothetical protein RR191_03250 [Cetobacterium sp.]|uniref:FomA family porin-like outer membrane protein n=1 Tax=Cetobacterium sp. TaxID=2071632 RepID=UPI002FCACFED